MASVSPLQRGGLVIELLGLALMVGGMLALGAFTAPTLFKNLPLSDAGRVMTMIFRRYDNVLFYASLLIIAGEALKAITVGMANYLGEFATLAERLRVGLVVVVLTLCTISLSDIHPQMETMQQQGVIRGVGEAGKSFDKLHHRSEMYYKLQLLAAALALVSLGIKPLKHAKTA